MAAAIAQATHDLYVGVENYRAHERHISSACIIAAVPLHRPAMVESHTNGMLPTIEPSGPAIAGDRE